VRLRIGFFYDPRRPSWMIDVMAVEIGKFGIIAKAWQPVAPQNFKTGIVIQGLKFQEGKDKNKIVINIFKQQIDFSSARNFFDISLSHN